MQIAFALVVAGISVTTAEPRTFDAITYTPPAGWSMMADSRGEILSHGTTDADSCVISVYASVPNSGLAATFKSEWNAKVVAAIKPSTSTPPSESKLASGISSMTGIGQGSALGGPMIGLLAVLDGGDRATSVVMLSPTLGSMAGCKEAFGTIVAGMRFKSNVAAAPTPGPSSGPPSLGAVPEKLRASDLAGKWVPKSATAFQTAYYSRSNGAFTSSDTSVGLESYVFDAKGNFTFKETGLMHGSYYNQAETGTASISGGVLVLTSSTRTRQLRLLGYEDRTDATILEVLPSSAEASEINIKTYGQYLIRTK